MIKNPFNYCGGKYKLLPQLFKYFPQNINNFYDIFGGGGDVSFNIKAKHIYLFDKNEELINIYQQLNDNFIKEIEKIINKYNLSKTNKEEYLKLRTYYNDNYSFGLKNINKYQSAVILYTLLSYSFNNFIGFNKKNFFNVPFGMNRSSFNISMKNKLKKYINFINNNDINFIYKDFKDINVNNFNKEDFIYLDPPYLITTGSYLRSYNLKWNKETEKELLLFIKKIIAKKINFGLSNVIEHKGLKNNLLINFIKDNNLKMEILNKNYNNCNYQCLNTDKKTIEIYVYN